MITKPEPMDRFDADPLGEDEEEEDAPRICFLCFVPCGQCPLVPLADRPPTEEEKRFAESLDFTGVAEMLADAALPLLARENTACTGLYSASDRGDHGGTYGRVTRVYSAETP